MPDLIERAASGRAKCRGCKQKLAKDEPRFGEAVPNPFGEGETTHWFCLPCAAEKRPDKLIAALDVCALDIPTADDLRRTAQNGVDHPRLSRLAHAERSPTGRARCRHCREVIDKGALRIALEFTDEGMTTPGGFIHVPCAADYFGTTVGVLPRLRRTSDKLEQSDFLELEQGLGPPSPGPANPEHQGI